MAGIYIHIPFCTKACNYCDFHFSTSLKSKKDLLVQIQKELKDRVNYIQGEKVETIYFGGGTPSLLDKEEIKSILNTIKEVFVVVKTAEITLEANPDDLTKEKLLELKQAGINRLSIGIQSFNDAHLQWMNRSHSVEQSIRCVKDAQAIGFDNISIDLIYGIPNLSKEEWKKNIKQAIALHPQHISSYCLTVEDKTVLSHEVAKKKVFMPSEDVTSKQFHILIKQLAKNGFEQYEISNFSKNGFEAKHNSSYWKQALYIGVGPSAHSFDGKSRRWNVANNAQYIKGVKEETVYWEEEEIDEITGYNEYVLTNLRTKWGIDISYLSTRFSSDIVRHFQKEVYNFIKNGLIEITPQNTYVLSKTGKFLADGIASDLFYV